MGSSAFVGDCASVALGDGFSLVKQRIGFQAVEGVLGLVHEVTHHGTVAIAAADHGRAPPPRSRRLTIGPALPSAA